MFSEKQIRYYRSVKAPEALYQKVKENAQNPVSHRAPQKVYGLLAFAASLILILGLSFWFRPESSVTVAVNGQLVKDCVSFSADLPASQKRSSSFLNIPLEIQVKGETRIFVSEGVLVTPSGESVTSYTTKEDVLLTWEISRFEESIPCTVDFEDEKGTVRFALISEDEQMLFLQKQK